MGTWLPTSRGAQGVADAESDLCGMVEASRPDENPAQRWDAARILTLVGYLTLAFGYLMAILRADPLEWRGFTIITVAIACAAVLFGVYLKDAVPRISLALLLGLAACSILAEVGIYFGMDWDWLICMVVVTVAVTSFPMRIALAVLFGLCGVTAVIMWHYMVIVARQPIGHFVSDELSVLPAFAFTFAFAYFARLQVQERRRSELLRTELETAHRQLQAYSAQVGELSATRERNRIAREIHDTLGHYLTILSVQLETAIALEKRVRADAREGKAGAVRGRDDELAAELAEARRVATECLAEVRRSVSALRPNLAAPDVSQAIAALAREFEAAQPGAEVVLDLEADAATFSPEVRMTVYRAVQEALTNARKHAQATKVLVRLRAEGEEAELTVLDNGVGGSGPHGDGRDESGGREPGFGLLGMRERVELLGGTARALAEPGRGWRVEVRIPLPSGAAATSAAGQTVAAGEQASAREIEASVGR